MGGWVGQALTEPLSPTRNSDLFRYLFGGLFNFKANGNTPSAFGKACLEMWKVVGVPDRTKCLKTFHLPYKTLPRLLPIVVPSRISSLLLSMLAPCLVKASCLLFLLLD